MKNAQISTEYLIVVGFVTFLVFTIFSISIIYSNTVKDRIILDQSESFAKQLINSAESVFFAGEPSKATINLYLPQKVSSIEINGTDVIISVSTGSGENKRAYESAVPLQGEISVSEGTKRLTLTAREGYVEILPSS